MREIKAPFGVFFIAWNIRLLPPVNKTEPMPTSDPSAEPLQNVNSLALKPPPRLLLMLLSALAVIPFNMPLPSLPHIGESFGGNVAPLSLSVAGYAIGTATAELLAGALSDRYGRRPVALCSILIFTVASIGCALSVNLVMFLACRILQASVGACFSVSLVIIKETSSGDEALRKSSNIAIGWALAPMLGPVVSGVIDTLFGWRANFLALAALGLLMLLGCFRHLQETARIAERSQDSHLRAYRRLLGSRRFLAYTSCTACSLGTLYIFLAGAPLAIDRPSAELGLYMGFLPIGFICGSFLAGRFGPALRTSRLLILARLLTCLALLAGLALAGVGLTTLLAFFAPCMFIGIGNGMSLSAANIAALSVEPKLAGTAAGLAAAVTIAGGALVSGITSLLLAAPPTRSALLTAMLISASFACLAAITAARLEGKKQE
ncbi:MFS transporter [Oryzifoliimicrobium ureilyticus]|uniref:MFS transporter n=1 Tax=Oryzifoliimicrobium ureilyticus TaxID=3113724 RepID=UPI0030767AC9